MNKLYKIKVGIEEFPIEEKDIPRITEAMKNNDMVALDSGIFRGSAILAICRDEEREKRATMLETMKPTPEQLERFKNEEQLREIENRKRANRLICELCDHSGWKEEMRNEEVIRVICDCQKLL